MIAFGQFARSDLEYGFADNILTRQSEVLCKGRIAPQINALAILVINRRADGIENRSQQQPLLAQFFLDLLARGNIPDDSIHFFRPTQIVTNQHPSGRDIFNTAIRPDNTVFRFIRHALLNGSGKRRLKIITIIRMYYIEKLFGSSFECRPINTEKPAHLIVKVPFIIGQIQAPYAHLCRFQCKIKFCFICTQGVLSLLANSNITP